MQDLRMFSGHTKALQAAGINNIRADAPAFFFDGTSSKEAGKLFGDLPMAQKILSTPFWHAWRDMIPKQNVQLPLNIPPERWFEGTWIVANQGRGKTNLLRHLVLNMPQDACLILMDAKGDLINSFNHLAYLKDHLVFIDPDPDCPLAINPLNVGSHSVEFLEYVFAALLETPLTPLQATLFRLTLTLAVTVPHATLETFRNIIQNGWKKYEPYVRKLRPRDQDFFDKEFDSADLHQDQARDYVAPSHPHDGSRARRYLSEPRHQTRHGHAHGPTVCNLHQQQL